MDELRDRLAEDGEIQVERVDLAAELVHAARHGGFKLVVGIAGQVRYDRRLHDGGF